jgi:hypothetical protein
MYARGRPGEGRQPGTRLLIDAEQVRFQPAIDSLVLELQRTYNAKSVSDKPIVYNTYQCYLKDVPDRLAVDVERSGALTITLEPAGAWRVEKVNAPWLRPPCRRLRSTTLSKTRTSVTMMPWTFVGARRSRITRSKSWSPRTIKAVSKGRVHEQARR